MTKKPTHTIITITPVGRESRSFEPKPDWHRFRAALNGGYIETAGVKTFEGKRVYEAYVDEEGLLKGLPINPRASALCGGPRVGNLVISIKGDLTNKIEKIKAPLPAGVEDTAENRAKIAAAIREQ